MAEPMRIRAQAAGDKTTVRVLMSHEMETGQRKDSAGKTVPAWFIQEVSATHNACHTCPARAGCVIISSSAKSYLLAPPSSPRS